MKIKGKEIGQGQPLICVSVMGHTKEEIVNSIESLVKESTDMIEWRVDFFDKADDLYEVENVLKAIKVLVEKTILVFTYRSKKQGGEGQLDLNTILKIQHLAAKSKVCDLIDYEYFAASSANKDIEELKKEGARIIVSHHDFNETPEKRTIEILLEEMKKSKADIVKIALMPNKMIDVLNLLEKTNEFHEKYPETPLITMSMGKLGSVSRITGEYFGSCVTFGAGKIASAPGQFAKDDLKLILENIHKSLK